MQRREPYSDQSRGRKTGKRVSMLLVMGESVCEFHQNHGHVARDWPLTPLISVKFMNAEVFYYTRKSDSKMSSSRIKLMVPLDPIHCAISSVAAPPLSDHVTPKSLKRATRNNLPTSRSLGCVTKVVSRFTFSCRLVKRLPATPASSLPLPRNSRERERILWAVARSRVVARKTLTAPVPAERKKLYLYLIPRFSLSPDASVSSAHVNDHSEKKVLFPLLPFLSLLKYLSVCWKAFYAHLNL